MQFDPLNKYGLLAYNTDNENAYLTEGGFKYD